MPFSVPFEVKKQEDGGDLFVSKINEFIHKHDWYKIGKHIRCKSCTIELLDDDDTFLKVLKQNESK